MGVDGRSTMKSLMVALDPSHQRQLGAVRAYAAGFCAAVIWGAWPIVSKVGIRASLSPFDVAALRFSTAGILLAPALIRCGLGRLPWHIVALLAGGAGVPYVLLMVTGLMFAPANHAGIIGPGCTMLVTAIGGALLVQEEVSRRRKAAIVIVVFGLSLMLIAPESSQSHEWLGDLLFVAAGSFWGLFAIIARARKLTPLHAASIVAVVSMAIYLPPYLALRGFAIFSANLGEVILQVIFQGILSAIIALMFYTFAVARLGVIRAGMFPSLAPALAMVFAWFVLGETPNVQVVAGVAVVSAGMAIALTRGSAC